MTRKGTVLSFAVHVLFLLGLLGVWNRAGSLAAPTHLPGAKNGTVRLLTFSMGGAPPQPHSSVVSRDKKVTVAVSHRENTAKSVRLISAPASSSPGNGTSGENALGDGNISIALVKFHPRPAPDLSTLAPGTAGDVVLDATIDAQGKIVGLKLSKGFGGTIDSTVIATVQQWTFVPATKDGVPIASEQEILFHYERS